MFLSISDNEPPISALAFENIMNIFFNGTMPNSGVTQSEPEQYPAIKPKLTLEGKLFFQFNVL